MSKLQKKLNIDLNIKSATINNAQELTEILIIWKRSNKTIDTKTKSIDRGQPLAVFNEKFQMKTVLEYDALRRQFVKKKSDLQVWKRDMSSMIGVAEFDLSKYATVETL